MSRFLDDWQPHSDSPRLCGTRWCASLIKTVKAELRLEMDRPYALLMRFIKVSQAWIDEANPSAI